MSLCQVTFIINKLPDNHNYNNNIYISGDFEGWSGGKDQFKLEQNNTNYFITVHRFNESIKFKFTLKKAPPLDEGSYIELEKWRIILFKMKLIGEYPIEKVGYGNISRKIAGTENEFIISGTQTGKYQNLNALNSFQYPLNLLGGPILQC